MSRDADEELAVGHRRPVPVWTVVAWVVALAIVAGFAFLLGRRHDGREAAATRTATVTVSAVPSVSAPVGSGPGDLDATDRRCSLAAGVGHLQLGIEMVNHGRAPVELRDLHPVLPLGGLKATRSAVGTCGQLPPSTPVRGYRVAPGATGWMTITFDVQEACPGFLPVGFAVRYLEGGSLVAETLASFSDLGDVPYPGCASSSR
jgi:hypothetical protein